jgi:tetraacyldisaccharide 4'-kinase
MSWLLAPAGALAAELTARRVARPGWHAPVPVLCCGNAGVGGAGKTTVALDIARRLLTRGVAVHCLSRGYGGRSRGVLRVDPAVHDAALVGDEPLLLAAVAPTWVAADRGASARAAVQAGAQALLLDDGLQNPTLVQDAALLVVDGAAGFGNGRVMPAGPLRESVAAAAARCRAAVLIGPDTANARAVLPPGLPVLTASLRSDTALDGARVLAFSGIARPAKFHGTLRQAGAIVAECMEFPDHHRFTGPELDRMLARAAVLDAVPVTTPKDAVRLPATVRSRIRVVGVALVWDDPAAIERLLAEVMP